MAGETADFYCGIQIIVWVLLISGAIIFSSGTNFTDTSENCQKINKIYYCYEEGYYKPYLWKENTTTGNYSMYPIQFKG